MLCKNERYQRICRLLGHMTTLFQILHRGKRIFSIVVNGEDMEGVGPYVFQDTFGVRQGWIFCLCNDAFSGILSKMSMGGLL
jgi:hypothetical protein